ncbi:MAG TPA: hypothetical protein VHS59_01910 [Bacillota bacterium]|nr:hypothetical protein [Bacillota bacterium]
MRDEERIEIYHRFGFLDWKSEMYQGKQKRTKAGMHGRARGLRRIAERLFGKLGNGI